MSVNVSVVFDDVDRVVFVWVGITERFFAMFSLRIEGCVAITSQRELNTKAERVARLATTSRSVASCSDKLQISSLPFISHTQQMEWYIVYNFQFDRN